MRLGEWQLGQDCMKKSPRRMRNSDISLQEPLFYQGYDVIKFPLRKWKLKDGNVKDRVLCERKGKGKNWKIVVNM